jgi:hypothetical protein
LSFAVCFGAPHENEDEGEDEDDRKGDQTDGFSPQSGDDEVGENKAPGEGRAEHDSVNVDAKVEVGQHEIGRVEEEVDGQHHQDQQQNAPPQRRVADDIEDPNPLGLILFALVAFLVLFGLLDVLDRQL